jgi:hypothetical protein
LALTRGDMIILEYERRFHDLFMFDFVYLRTLGLLVTLGYRVCVCVIELVKTALNS